MVLSSRWQVSDDDLAAHISALQTGQVPDMMQDAVEVPLAEKLAPPVSASPQQSPQKFSPRKTQPCPQQGLPMKSPRQASSILQSTALTTLSSPFRLAGNREPFLNLAIEPRRDSTSAKVKGRICGPTRLDLLLKQDTIPCMQDGRRFNGAMDSSIRLYIKMPSIEASISMWVDPDLPVHPVHGVDAALDSAASVTEAPEVQKWRSSPQTTLSHTVRDAHCLQDVIEQSTGVPANKQNLRLGAVRLDLNGDSHVPDGSTLRQCGINHGCQILMNSTSTAVHHHLMAQSQQNRTTGAWISPRWQSEQKPQIFGQMPEGGYLSTQSPFCHNYCELPELGATDPCDAIRGRFMSKRR